MLTKRELLLWFFLFWPFYSLASHLATPLFPIIELIVLLVILLSALFVHLRRRLLPVVNEKVQQTLETL